ncbi:hypothetical protein DFS34DRAFT_582097 [Phlyctochytrium arcticum]|nr:hypothetical protein DFS34DRAFT_582097 [Phlyctochytrium arcticum]
MAQADYRALADMNSRAACPRCEGFGYAHLSTEKHDKAPKLRCKKCATCKVCDGSGVTMGKIPCGTCQGRGFVHKAKEGGRPHNTSKDLRCMDCIDCKACEGMGVLDLKKLKEEEDQRKAEAKKRLLDRQKAEHLAEAQRNMIQAPQYPPPPPIFWNPSLGPPPPPPQPPIMMPHHFAPGAAGAGYGPHGGGMIGTPYGPMPAYPGQPVPGPSPFGDQPAAPRPHRVRHRPPGDPQADVSPPPKTEMNARSKCPCCDGNGFRHTSSAKHDKKKTERCKSCIPCKGNISFSCQSSGYVQNKRACTSCNTRGFVHPSTSERNHDVPQNLRCFFCKDCSVCKGIGVEDIPTS